MKTHPREILIFYNPDSASDRKTVAYANTITNHVKSFSYAQANATPTLWIAILDKLDVEPKKLFNKALPEYQKKLKGKDFDKEGWLHVIQNHPHLLRAPIAVRGDKAILCESPTDILRL